MTSKLLWDDQYLEDFAKSLQNGCPEQFWEWNQNDELEELKVCLLYTSDAADDP